MEKFVTRSVFSFSTIIILMVVVLSSPSMQCPSGMVRVDKGDFCIDQYEWPNQEGVYPDFALTAYQAEAFCRSEGKRLCTHEEWVMACKGPDNLAYGYGSARKEGVCNDNAPNYIYVDWSRMSNPVEWKKYAKTLYKGVPSGSKPECYTDEGAGKVYDMIGNVREWVVNPKGNGGYDFESSYWYGTMIGPVGCGFDVPNHSPGFASYEVGTRCCKSN